MNLPLEKISVRYSRDQFLWDLIAFIPFGALEYYNEVFVFLWLIKVIRIRQVKQYLSKRFYQQIAEDLIKKQQQMALMDKKKKYNKNQDYNYGSLKIIFRGIFKFFSMLIQLMLIVVIVANFWQVFIRL